jgi:hypothetical protein
VFGGGRHRLHAHLWVRETHEELKVCVGCHGVCGEREGYAENRDCCETQRHAGNEK